MPHTGGTFFNKGVLIEDSILYLYNSLAGTGNAKTVFVPFYKMLQN